MIKKSYLYLVLAAASLPLLPGCVVRQALFVSPFNGNNLEYHPIPRVNDSVHMALYSSLTYSNGSANDFGTDYLWSFHSSVFAAHQYDNFQFHYGVGLTLGKYMMGTWRVDTGYRGYTLSPNTALPTAVQVNTYSGPHSFGGVGFQGGINGVMPVWEGEWRYLGLETSVTQEFGNYLAVRKRMPDSIATLINKSPLFATLGITTELITHVHHGDVGFKWTFGWALGHAYSNPGLINNTNGDRLSYTYFNFTFHYTYRQFTGYLQYDNATKARLILLGVDYRLWAGAKK
ncbi:MAG TPA: hypothetical protein VFE32_17720 [Puia sp.]|jgi:hypothetical protein|nr:hypothetical protein [Puia sp.]